MKEIHACNYTSFCEWFFFHFRMCLFRIWMLRRMCFFRLLLLPKTCTQFMFREHKRAIVVYFGNSGLDFKFKLWRMLSVTTHFIFHTNFWLLFFLFSAVFKWDVINHNIWSGNLNLCHDPLATRTFWIITLGLYEAVATLGANFQEIY